MDIDQKEETKSFNDSFTEQQVAAWFNTHFPKYATKFEGLTAKDVLSLSRKQITKVIPDLPGFAIYNALHPAIQGFHLRWEGSLVSGFTNDGFNPSGFCTFHDDSVSSIIALNSNCLFASPPFTGKTSLCQLIKQKLDTNNICNLHMTFLSYDPTCEHIIDYCERKLGRKFSSLEEEKNYTYILFDELQVSYPSKEEEIKSCFHIPNQMDIKEIASQHKVFHNQMKSLMQNCNIRILGFSAYTSSNPAFAKISTPYTFSFNASVHLRDDNF